jgi:acyl-CoA thioester hydrolase
MGLSVSRSLAPVPGAAPAAGRSVGIELAVRFAETDAMGLVHHSNYAVWFEAARVAWMDAIGLPYAEFAAGGHHFAVTALQVEFRAPARFGDTVRVGATLARLRSRHVAFRYTVSNVATGALLASGATEHVCVDLSGRTAKIPARLFGCVQSGGFSSE